MATASKKILVVDDDRNMTELLDAVLRCAGFGVTIAHSGREALDRAREDPPDAILLDVVLPGMDGWETCRQIKAAEPVARAPVYFITGRSEPEDVAICSQAGGAALLVKPIDVGELLDHLGGVDLPAGFGRASR